MCACTDGMSQRNRMHRLHCIGSVTPAQPGVSCGAHPSRLAESVHSVDHGSTTLANVPAKSAVLRVINTSPFASAVAAIQPSIALIGLPALSRRAINRPQASAVAASIASIRPAKRGGRSSRSQASSNVRRRPGARRSTPRRSSAIVTTLRNSSSSSVASRNATTPGFGRGFCHSETTLVSSRKLTARRRAVHPCCARHQDASPAMARRRKTRQGCRRDLSAVPTPQSRQRLLPVGHYGLSPAALNAPARSHG